MEGFSHCTTPFSLYSCCSFDLNIHKTLPIYHLYWHKNNFLKVIFIQICANIAYLKNTSKLFLSSITLLRIYRPLFISNLFILKCNLVGRVCLIVLVLFIWITTEPIHVQIQIYHFLPISFITHTNERKKSQMLFLHMFY